MDYLVMRAFITSLQSGKPFPIDEYDADSWMAMTCLSEQSIAMGSMPVPVPDFTDGRWICREKRDPDIFSLDDVYPEVPEAMIEEQVSDTLDNYARRMQSQGLTMEQYMQFTGMTVERMREDIRPQAEKRIRTRLVLEAVVAAENLEAPEAAVEAEIKRMADNYKMEPERARELLGEEGLRRLKEDLAVQEAVDFLVAEATPPKIDSADFPAFDLAYRTPYPHHFYYSMNLSRPVIPLPHSLHYISSVCYERPSI